MKEFLKGSYKIEANIIESEKKTKNEYEEKALNSIGGSMVFVERKRMTWKPEE